jgi:hypothetical protein
MSTVRVACTCGATVHADVFADGVTHTTICAACGGRVHTTIEVTARRAS